MSKQLFPCRLHGKPRLLVHLESFPTSDGGVEYQCHPLHVCTFLTKGVAGKSHFLL